MCNAHNNLTCFEIENKFTSLHFTSLDYFHNQLPFSFVNYFNWALYLSKHTLL